MSLYISKCRLVVLTVFCLLEIFLFGALQFGWFSLVYILKEDGVFGNLCVTHIKNISINTNETAYINCFPQDERFNLLFSIGVAIVTFSCVIVGQLYFTFDSRKVRLLTMSVAVTGLLCFGFTSEDLPWLVFPGIVLMGISGHSLLISNMEIPSLLPSGSSLYVGLMAGCFESSIFTQMVVKKLYENRINRVISYSSISAAFVVISGLCTLLRPQPVKSKKTSTNACKGSINDSYCPEATAGGSKTNSNVNDGAERQKSVKNVNKLEGFVNGISLLDCESEDKHEDCFIDYTQPKNALRHEEIAHEDAGQPSGVDKIFDANKILSEHTNKTYQEDESNNDNRSAGTKSEMTLKTASSQHKIQDTENDKALTPREDIVTTNLWKTLRSRIFLSHLAWTSSVLLRCYYFIGSINRFLEINAETKSEVSYFLDVLTYTMLGGFLSSFVAGSTLQLQHRWYTGTMRMVIPLTVTSSLGVLLSSLTFVSTTSVLYAHFVILTCFRSFIYSVNIDFIRTTFHQKYTGILYGVVLSVSGAITFTQYALFAWTEKYYDAIVHVNLFLLCLSITSLLHPMQIYITERRISGERN